MKIDVTSFDGQTAGSIELSDEVFGLEPRADLIFRMIRWQLAKRRAGTHAVKNRAEIARTGKKMYKQKGTGGARHGSARVPQFRGGGRAFGPQVRSHEHDLTKKVKALALKHALSAKAKDGAIVIWENAQLAEPKTKLLKAGFDKTGLASALIIDGAAPQINFALAARNLPKIDVLPVEGVNVYDILPRDKLVLTKAAIDALEARFKRARIRAITTSSSLRSSPRKRRSPPRIIRWFSGSLAPRPSRRSRRRSKVCSMSRSMASTPWCARARRRPFAACAASRAT